MDINDTNGKNEYDITIREKIISSIYDFNAIRRTL